MNRAGATEVGAGPEQIESEVRELREELGGLVGELDRRAHRALDWRLQIERHGPALAVGGVTAMAVLAGLASLRARRRARLGDPWLRLSRALAAASREPPRRTRRLGPTLAALGSAGGVLARECTRRALRGAPGRRRTA